MTATSHALIGTVIAAKVGNPVLAIPLAVASHIACDLFPHWDAGTHRETKTKRLIFIESVIDVLLGFALSYLLIVYLFPQTDLFYALIMILAAQSFDWITAFYNFLDMKFPPFSWVKEFQRIINKKLDKPWGIINQAIVVILIIVLAKLV